MSRNVVDVVVVNLFRVVCRWFGCLHTSDHDTAGEARIAAATHQTNHRNGSLR